jgi:hypothetical protein
MVSKSSLLLLLLDKKSYYYLVNNIHIKIMYMKKHMLIFIKK